MAKTFFYYAYGSNLLQQRIHINNPTATRSGIGYLENYALTFCGHSKRWKGAPATIVNVPGKTVWGAIWELMMVDQANLDKQETCYYATQVDVKSPEGCVKNCRVYIMTQDVTWIDFDKLPSERRPSKAYIGTICAGARESNLPKDYIQLLESIPDNGYGGEVEIAVDLTKAKS